MTYADVRLARQYTDLYGPLSPMRMYDRPSAQIAYLLSKANGGSPKSLSDFMPFQQRQDEILFEDE